MMNKRNAIIAFLLIAVLALAIGYAATISDDLFVAGTLLVDPNATGVTEGPGGPTKPALSEEWDEDIYFVDAQAPALVTATIGNDENGDENDKLTIDVAAGAFNSVDKVLEVTVWVQNDNEQTAANITVDPATVNFDFFTVEVAPVAGTQVAANGKIQYKITMTLVGIPAEVVTETFTIDFTAAPVA